MKNSTHYIKTSFRHDDYIKDILERAATLTKLSQSELIRNACLGQYVPMLQTASVPRRKVKCFILYYLNCMVGITQTIEQPTQIRR